MPKLYQHLLLVFDAVKQTTKSTVVQDNTHLLSHSFYAPENLGTD